MTTYKRKLIEVALPLAAINAAAAAEGSTGQRPHPKNLHRWWARRPLAVARAIVWASLIDDPSCNPDLDEEAQTSERQRLFRLLEALVDDLEVAAEVLDAARAEVTRCIGDAWPTVVDPFSGGGAIPLEAQRLGLDVLAGDINPVSVLVQRGMMDIPVRFVGKNPVGELSGQQKLDAGGTAALAADVEHYARRLRDRVFDSLGHCYPPITLSSGGTATPLVWIWARTVASPDPSWSGQVPLVASWDLLRKKGKPRVWIEPLVDPTTQTISYAVRTGGAPTIEKTVNRSQGRCLATGAAIPADYIDREAEAGRLGAELMAIVADGPHGRTYLSPDEIQRSAASAVPSLDVLESDGFVPHEKTRGTFAGNAQGRYFGMFEFKDYFTTRQLACLGSFVSLVGDIQSEVRLDAIRAGYPDDTVALSEGGSGATAYAEAVATYLAFAVDKLADFSSSLCSWNAPNGQLRYTFTRQAIAMTWDFAEVNPFSDRMSSFMAHVGGISASIRDCLVRSAQPGSVSVRQLDAKALLRQAQNGLVSTDPPYYDNIVYSDLSDYFYVWLKRSLKSVWPDELATILTPKAEELVANQYRAGGRSAARAHFELGMFEFMQEVASSVTSEFPASIYYAYKAQESSSAGRTSTGWDTFLQATVDAGLRVVATWPVRTERQGRTNAIGANALASSIVLVCRPREERAQLATRAEFVAALRAELPDAVRLLQTGNIAPVDLAQSTIGPGIGVFTRYAKVVEADGSSMSVSDALAIINDVLGEVLDGEEAELDRDTRFAVTWYTQNGYNPGRSGDADSLARAKNTSLNGVEDSGIGEARGGQFRLFERSELNPDWDPVSDDRRTVWEATQYLVAALERSETEAAELLHRMGGYADRARQLAYVLFQKATDKGWAEEAGAYNGLITAWPSLQAMGGTADAQGSLL